MRISDWSSDVCSSDLGRVDLIEHLACLHILAFGEHALLDDAADLRAYLGDHVRHSPAGKRLLHRQGLGCNGQIGRAHVCTPVTNAHLVCRLLLEKKNDTILKSQSKLNSPMHMSDHKP